MQMLSSGSYLEPNLSPEILDFLWNMKDVLMFQSLLTVMAALTVTRFLLPVFF